MLKLMATGLRWLWVAVVVFALDRISKEWALASLTPYDPYPVMKSFNFTLAYNRGAAFSFLHNASGWQTWLFGSLAVAISLAIIFYLAKLSARQRWLSIAFTLIVGGAIGNLYDRIYYGYVIDFIEWYMGNWYWPAFNIADSAICLGAVMLGLDLIFNRKSKQTA